MMMMIVRQNAGQLTNSQAPPSRGTANHFFFLSLYSVNPQSNRKNPIANRVHKP